MTNTSTGSDRKAIFILSSAAGIIGGLCCLTPIVLVLFGLASVSAAASLGNVLYGDYRWLFRILALIFVGIGLAVYFRRLGICTLDAAKRERNRLINVSLLVLLVTLGAYIFWTYVVLHYWGIAAGLPWAQYDESWAIPIATVVFAVAAVVSFAIRRAELRVAGMSLEEAARAMGSTVAAVRRMAHHAYENLRSIGGGGSEARKLEGRS